MANEFEIFGGMRVSKDGKNRIRIPAAFFDTFTGSKITDIEQTIGTSEEALDLGDITVPKWFMIENLDATNYVSIRRATGEGNFMKVRAGHTSMPIELEATAPFAIADTANVNIRIWVTEQ